MNRLALYFLRHGQTAASKSDLFSGSRANPPLTEDGQRMATQFAAAYEKVSWKAIFVSPLQRTLQTVAPIAKAASLQPWPRDELKEIDYGAWDGKGKADVERGFHDDYLRWSADPARNAPTGGETAIAIARRGRALIEEIRATITAGNVLLVSHKATIRVMLCDLLGIDLSRFRDRLSCPVGSVSVVEFGDRGPLLSQLADRSYQSEHLRSQPGT